MSRELKLGRDIEKLRVYNIDERLHSSIVLGYIDLGVQIRSFKKENTRLLDLLAERNASIRRYNEELTGLIAAVNELTDQWEVEDV